MANHTARKSSFRNLDSKPELHFPYVPEGVYAKMACCNLGFQMRWSAEELERRLEEQGSPHVLQFLADGDDQEPESWRLYADGTLVASGTGAYARSCFEVGENHFLEVLAKAVESAALPEISPRECWLLRRAAAIAKAS